MMINATYNKREIKNLTNNYMTFEKGGRLYKSGAVKEVTIGESETVVVSKIHDKATYTGKLKLDKFGKIDDYECSCEYFQSNPEVPCYHLVALMLAVLHLAAEYRQKTAALTPLTRNQTHPTVQQDKYYNVAETNRLLGFLQYELMDENDFYERVPLQVEYMLTYQPYQDNHNFSLRMKVGLDHLYQVKDCESVVNDILNGNQLPFGKKFIYTPEQHELTEADHAVFVLLKQIAEAARTSGRDLRTVEDRKEIIIPNSMMKEILLKLAENANVSLKTNQYQKQEMKLRPEQFVTEFKKLPLSFAVSELPDGGLLFSEIKDFEKTVLLFGDSGLLLVDETIYFLNQSTLERLATVNAMLVRSAKEGMRIPPDKSADFLAIAVPALRKIVGVLLTDEVQGKYQSFPLKTELYLDWQKERLILEVFFNYGEAKIDVAKESMERIDLTPESVIRDRVAERVIAKKFMDAGKHAYLFEDTLFLQDVDQISAFLYEGLDKLAPHCEIFTTAAVENLLYQPVRLPKVAIELNNQSRLLDVTFSTDEISMDDLKQMVRQIAANKSYHRLSNGKIVNLRQKEIKELTDAVVQLDVPLKDLKTEMSLPLYKAFGLDTDAGIVHQDEEFMTLINRMEKPEKIDFDLPEDLNATLRPYQETGYKWLKGLDHYGFGGILADDMGLGKTLQVISFIAGSLSEGDGKPYLVICPSSVLYNWQKEFKQFAPGIQTQLITGTKSERSDCVTAAIAENIPVWITSYPLLQRDEDLYEGKAFRTVILDEAQSVKNATAKTTKAASALQANNKIALSGTPIENALSELYTIFSIAQPGLFGTRTNFKQMEPAQIAKKVKPFILRRLKADVLKDLPPKIESISYIEMTEKQKTVYLSQLQLMRQETKEMLDADTLNENRIKILAGLTRLRQICCDPALVMADYNGGSGKLDRLMEYLAEAKENGRRVVLFSQFTQMLAIIRKKLDAAGEAYFYLDGQTPNQDRLTLTTRFNEGEKDLFLISLKAGGTGLNLTGGDTVILYDSWWNPAVESQATDRVHRFGQKKVVQVVRLIATGTIEERINELQEQKREMIDSVIQAGGQSVTSLSKEELMQLLEI
ncbi:DEAD/DEAH box helicase [Trichococcus alkaliphilus]|uniref:DEAD/DEAH box helicase n=1 Tax=Trichococcus alkaliphilus TaxID=2052943 RepID=UPI000D0BA4BE|nr:DEAD/DEAH box helicase [Trichococcus alkaliphilus]